MIRKLLSIRLLILLLILCPALTMYAQKSGQIDKERITKEIEQLISDYKYFGKLVESYNDLEVSEAYMEAFKELFAEDAKVYNDIPDSESFRQMVGINEYTKELAKHFPKGLFKKIQVQEEIEMPEKLKNENEIRMRVIRQTSGYYEKNEGEKTIDTEIYFIVSFDKYYDNFKFKGIEVVGDKDGETEVVKRPKEEDISEKAEETAKRVKAKKKEKIRVAKAPKVKKPRTTKVTPMVSESQRAKARRIYAGIELTPAFTNFGTSFGFGGLEINRDYYKDAIGFDKIEGLGNLDYAARLNAQFFISQKIGFGAGIGISNYTALIENKDINPADINKTTEENTITYVETDMEGEEFKRLFWADGLTEKYRISNVVLPVSVHYEQFTLYSRRSRRAKIKLRFNAALGAELNYIWMEKTDFSADKIFSKNFYSAYPDMEKWDSKNAAEMIDNEKRWLYDDSFDKAAIHDPAILSNNININVFTKVGMALELGNGLIIYTGPQLNIGLLPLFDGYGDATGNRALLQYRKSELPADKYTNEKGENIYNNYPTGTFEDGYDYKNMIGSAGGLNTISIGWDFGIKIKLKKKDR